MKLTDKFKNDLVIDYAHFDGGSMVLVLQSLLPATAPPASFPAATLFSPTLNFIPPFSLVPNPPGAWGIIQGARPGTSPLGLAGDLALQQARGPFVVNTNTPNVHKNKNIVVSNISTYEINDTTQIKNVLGYTNFKTVASNDIDGTPYTIDSLWLSSCCPPSSLRHLLRS